MKIKINLFLWFVFIGAFTVAIVNLVPAVIHITDVYITLAVKLVLTMIIITFFYNLLFKIPIEKILTRIKGISNGDFDKKIEVKTSSEMNEIANGINALSQEMKNYNSSLEAKVNARTRELMQTREELENQHNALLNLLEDVNEEKEYKESQSKSLLENMGEGIVITEENGKINYVNPAFEKMFGFLRQDLIGKALSDSIKAFDLNGKELSPAQVSDAGVLTAKDQEIKLDMFTKDGSRKVSVVINAAPIKVRDQFKGVIRVVHDISDDISLQRQKDDFFSIASHELRTPLTVISGNLDIVLQGYGKSQLTKDDTELLKDTIEASDRLIHMVNDFLNVSRLDQGRLKYELEPVDATSIVVSAVEQVKPIADNKNIALKVDKPISGVIVDADPGLLREIIINLVGNAMKFTHKGGITVTEKVNNGILEVRVVDTGAGIRKDMQGLLFQRFQQVSERTLAREAGGTGLGLYISREFAKVMNGDLKLELSDLGKGSTFLLTLPIKKDKLKQ